VSVLVTLNGLRRKLLRNWAIRLRITLVLIVGYLLAKVLGRGLLWLSWSQLLLISRLRHRLLGSKSLLLELLLHARGLHEALCWLHARGFHEALCWLHTMLMADHRRIVLRWWLRRIGEGPVICWRHRVTYVLGRWRDQAGLEPGRDLPRRKRDDRPTRIVGLLGVMELYRSSLLAAGHLRICGGIVAGGLWGPLLLHGWLLLPLSGLVLGRPLREVRDGWAS
jgi:hypothetical protein